MSPLTMSVPVLGALTVQESLTTTEIFRWMLLGLCAHTFGFGLNDLIDHPIDRTLSIRQNHPLTTGRLKKWEAWSAILLQVPLALLIYRGESIGFGVLLGSIGLSVIYNLFSKRGRFSRFAAELSLASAIGLLCLAGTLTQTAEVTFGSLVFALALTLILLLLNSVPSGLKDLKTDCEFGAQSFVLTMGCQMRDDDQLFIPTRLRWYSGILQLGIMGAMGILIFQFRPSFLLTLLMVILTVYSALHLRMLLKITSFEALRFSLPLLSGYYHYVGLSLLLVERMPFWLQILYGLLVILLLSVPIRVSLGMWRNKNTSL